MSMFILSSSGIHVGVADADMRIRYDVMKHILVFNPRTKSVAFRGVPFLPANDVRRMNNGVFNAMTDEEYY
ncbi:hypothetical protein T4E_9544 [Trichinella pseudospiralis]|uniref:Uncharacterized protein n=1 Tax=Trichinella pseudospiralis TaxID=6337 RepID=A0A0V0Y934_TRIPS|nr:hypothetical protein T4E_9544 [Trichinella pseudospiralis]